MANLGSGLINWLGTQDAGAASEMKTILDIVDEISSTEAGFIDGVTAGTGAASKAVVLDASGDYFHPNGGAITIGHSAQQTISDGDGATNLVPEVQILGTAQADSSLLLGCFNATNTIAPTLALVKSGAATIAAGTAVADNEILGQIIAYGDDGTDLESPAAAIKFVVDDTVATGEMGGSIEFFCTADGGETLTKRWTMNVAGALVAATAQDVVMPANTAAALEITDATTALLAFDSRNTVTVQNVLFTQPASQTLPDGATSRFRLVSVAAPTVTLAGTTQVTTTNQGASLFVGGPTYNQSGGAVTVDQVSTLHIGAVTAGASVTITAPYMVSTGVSDCYLTNAGVWTDTACWSWGKDAIANATDAAIEGVLALLQPKSWKYRDDVHGHDFDRERVGIVYDELPEALRCPGQQSGVSAGVLSSFALAAIKMLYEKNKDLEARLARLGA